MIPREFRLLLHTARSCPDVGLIRNIVKTGIDWQVLLTLAARHCVRPLLFKTLNSACWDAVPERVQLALTSFNRANVQKNLRFTGELLRLQNLFEKNAIPIAAFKGPILAQSVYGDIRFREFSDLDLLVHESDLHRAEEILIASGYEPDFPDREYRTAFLSYQGQYAYRKISAGISVDLHWRLSNKGVPFPLQLAEIWPRLEQVTIGSRTVLTLSRDDLVLFLAAHGAKEKWSSLIWVCDFAELLCKSPNINWDQILLRTQRSHCTRSLFLA